MMRPILTSYLAIYYLNGKHQEFFLIMIVKKLIFLVDLSEEILGFCVDQRPDPRYI